MRTVCPLCRGPQSYDFDLNQYECPRGHVEFSEDLEQRTGVIHQRTNIVVGIDGLRTYGYLAVTS